MLQCYCYKEKEETSQKNYDDDKSWGMTGGIWHVGGPSLSRGMPGIQKSHGPNTREIWPQIFFQNFGNCWEFLDQRISVSNFATEIKFKVSQERIWSGRGDINGNFSWNVEAHLEYLSEAAAEVWKLFWNRAPPIIYLIQWWAAIRLKAWKVWSQVEVDHRHKGGEEGGGGGEWGEGGGEGGQGHSPPRPPRQSGWGQPQNTKERGQGNSPRLGK